jgi:RNAse (barnase) inhibitor barstar
MPDDEATLEFRLLQNGCVVLYHNPLLMEEHANALARQGWQVKEMYEAYSGTADEFFGQASSSLDFPNHFGKNLDGFRDCLGDISFPEGRRLALRLTRFDLVVKHDAQFAHIVLDICAEAERRWLMEGKRVLFLVQSSDPDLRFPPIGATTALWNFEEWLDSKRKGHKQ